MTRTEVVLADKPNIILCVCDQLRTFEVGCYGNSVIHTPNIDRLAAAGTRVETAVSNCPVCMPARSVLLSGEYSRRCTGSLNNAHDWLREADRWTMLQYPRRGRPNLPDETLPEVLRRGGYATAAIGKWHVHSWPDEVGFDDYLIPRVYHAHTGQSFTENGGPEFVPGGFSVDFEAERVAAYLRDRQGRERPFFLYYNISPPHTPLADAPEKYLDMYDPASIPLRPNVPRDAAGRLPHDDHWFKLYRWDFRYYEHELPYTDELPADYDLRQLIAEYYGLTTWVDDTVGKLLSRLDELGLDEDTIVLFCSDHGDMLGSHGRWQKNSLLEESTRVPMLARGPGVAANHVVDGQVGSLVDVAPTLLDMAGLTAPEPMDGQSLRPVLSGESVALERAHAFIEALGPGIAVRTPARLVGMPWRDGEPPVIGPDADAVYDLVDDPFQLNNQAGAPPDWAAELTERLREWDAATSWSAGG